MKILSLVFVVLLLSSIAVFSPIASVAGVDGTYVSVINPADGTTDFNYTNVEAPPTDANHPLGYFIANITVTDVADLSGYQVNLTWDPSLLKIASSSDVYLPSDHIFKDLSPIWVPPSIDNTAGYLGASCARGPGASGATFTGSGTMFQVKFNVTKVPGMGETLSCNLAFGLAGAFPTVLKDHLLSPIPFTPQNGYYQYYWPPPPPPPSEGATLTVEPSEIINSSIVHPQIIQINVTIKNVTDMYHYSFSLSYDPDILICWSITPLDALGETQYIPEIFIDNIAGVVEVNVTYYSPAEPITTLPEIALVNFKFRVKGVGATPLDLYSVNLTDSLGRPIPSEEPYDGFFANIIRDLAITNVISNVAWAYQTNFVQINVTVQNDGQIVENSIAVKAYYDSNLIGTTTIGSLNPSENITVTFDWNTTAVTPCRNYSISAEVLSVPFEINLTNNVYTFGEVRIRLMGDVNDDGKVDLDDLLLLIDAFWVSSSEPNWNENADLSNDGVISLDDLLLLIENFMKTG